MKVFKFVFLALLLIAYQSQAQINQKIEDFNLTNLQDGKSISLSQFKENKIVVIVFMSAYCPYSKSYQVRLNKLVQKLESEQKSVRFILINPENAQETEEMLKETAQNYKVPYLWDKGQVVTGQLQATKTPEAFILHQNLGQFFLKYHGAIDDNPQVPEEVSQMYLEQSIYKLLETNNLEISNIKPTGCLIKKP